MKVLCFTKGRGYGHAIPDMAIADALPQHEWTFASYSTGLTCLRAAGRNVFDIGNAVENFTVMAFKASVGISVHKPDVVIAHEEPAAIFAAAVRETPSIYLSAWLPPVGNVSLDAIRQADRALIWCEPGLFPALPNTEFCGPLIRLEKWHQGDARDSLQILAPMFGVISVIAGGHANEAKSPMADLIMEATKNSVATVLWVGGDATIEQKAAKYPHVRVLPFQDQIERVICASDLVITAANRTTTQDCAALGVPTISLSPQTNPMDDMFVTRLCSNVALNVRAVTPDILAMWIQRVLANPPPVRQLEPNVGQFATRLGQVMEEIAK